MPFAIVQDYNGDFVYLPIYTRGRVELHGGGYPLDDEEYCSNNDNRIYTGFNEAEDEEEEEEPIKAEDMVPAANVKGRKIAGANRAKKAYEVKANMVRKKISFWFGED